MARKKTTAPAPAPETKDRILLAAEDLFAREGYSGASVKAIAGQAGVTGAMIHYYFGSKEKLYHAVLDRIVDDFERMAREIVATGKPPVERLRIYFSWLFDYAAKHPNLSRLTVMGLGGAETPYFERMVERCLKPLFQMGVGFIRAGQEDGTFSHVDAAHLLVAVYSTILPYFSDQRFFGMLMGTDAASKTEIEKHQETVLAIVQRTLGIE